MGRRPLKGEQLDLVTANLNLKMLLGETGLRFFLSKDLLVEEEPAREKGHIFPLGDISAWVSSLEVRIDEKDRVQVQGKVEGKAVFYSAGGPRTLTWEDVEFREAAALPGALPGMEVGGHGRISFLGEEGAPLQAEGKLIYRLRMEVEVLLSVADSQQMEVVVGARDVSPEKVTRSVVAIDELVDELAAPLTLTRELEFEEELLYVKSLSHYLKDCTWEQGKEGISLKGELVTVIFFIAGSERGIREQSQQFSHQVACPELKKGGSAAIFPRVEYVSYDLLGKRARQRAYVDIFVRVTRTVQQEILCDIEDADAKKDYLLLSRSAGVARESLELVQRLNLPFPKEIAGGSARLAGLEVEVQEDRVVVTGSLEKTVYYLPALEKGPDEEEGEVFPLSVKVEDDFHRTLNLPGINPAAQVSTCFYMHSTEFAPAEAATLQVSHAVLEVKARQVETCPVVIPYRVPPGTSMVVYAVRAGDTLLKISRSYGLKPVVIARANGLHEDDPLEVGQRLLLPLLFYAD